MTPTVKAKEPKDMNLQSLVAIVILVGALSGAASAVLAWTGGRFLSPDARVTKLEHAIEARTKRVDSLLRVAENRDEALGDRVDNLTELTLMLVSMQCLNANPDIRAAAQQARVPCARVLRDQGITP